MLPLLLCEYYCTTIVAVGPPPLYVHVPVVVKVYDLVLISLSRVKLEGGVGVNLNLASPLFDM